MNNINAYQRLSICWEMGCCGTLRECFQDNSTPIVHGPLPQYVEWARRAIRIDKPIQLLEDNCLARIFNIRSFGKNWFSRKVGIVLPTRLHLPPNEMQYLLLKEVAKIKYGFSPALSLTVFLTIWVATVTLCLNLFMLSAPISGISAVFLTVALSYVAFFPTALIVSAILSRAQDKVRTAIFKHGSIEVLQGGISVLNKIHQESIEIEGDRARMTQVQVKMSEDRAREKDRQIFLIQEELRQRGIAV